MKINRIFYTPTTVPWKNSGHIFGGKQSNLEQLRTDFKGPYTVYALLLEMFSHSNSRLAVFYKYFMLQYTALIIHLYNYTLYCETFTDLHHILYCIKDPYSPSRL